MLYFYLGLASIACCVIQGIIYGWFASNQYNNVVHSIFDLWVQDPLEKAIFVNINDPCPKGTSNEGLTYSYGGTSGLCKCVLSDTYSNDQTDRYLQVQSLFECSSQTCGAGLEQEQVIDDISSHTIKVFFTKPNNANQEIQQKICTSRIEGYSFAKKAPEERDCGSNEKYCSNSVSQKGFDIDHGYCIPNNRECFKSGVQVPQQLQENEGIYQLPLVGFDISESTSGYYNVIDQVFITEKQFLDMNDIQYPPEYKNLLNRRFLFKANYMPRVKVRCRASLKETLSSYIGPVHSRNIALASMIFSVFSAIIQFFFTGFGDFVDMGKCDDKGCISYCEVKRVSKNHSKIKNIIFVAKPTILFLMLILNIIIVKCYISALNELGHMIDDQCLDSYVQFSTGYGYYYDNDFYNAGLTYGCLGLISAGILADQNVYYLIKTFFLLIFCQIKCSDLKKQETQSATKTSPQLTTEKEGLKNGDIEQATQQNEVQNNNKKDDIKKEEDKKHKEYPSSSKQININSKSFVDPTKTAIGTELPPLQRTYSDQLIKDKLKSEKLQNKKEKKQKQLEKLKAKLEKEQTNKVEKDKKEKKVKQPKQKKNKEGKKAKIQYSDPQLFGGLNTEQGNNDNFKKENNFMFSETNINVFGELYNENKEAKLTNKEVKPPVEIQQSNSLESIRFNKRNTKEIIQPPEAPVPPEQSEKHSVIDMDDDFFSNY